LCKTRLTVCGRTCVVAPGPRLTCWVEVLPAAVQPLPGAGRGGPDGQAAPCPDPNTPACDGTDAQEGPPPCGHAAGIVTKEPSLQNGERRGVWSHKPNLKWSPTVKPCRSRGGGEPLPKWRRACFAWPPTARRGPLRACVRLCLPPPHLPVPGSSRSPLGWGSPVCPLWPVPGLLPFGRPPEL
jgi:hypothetical protein